MLYKLSIKNIKKSFKDYAIYFTTLILGVCIFYIFNSMDSQSAMLNITKNQSDMIELLTEVLSYLSIFVSFILGFLIIYASRFLIKKRNKEFGIYMTLGMSKRKISILLLFETIIIGLISLVLGLLLGIVISQVTSIFVANMFEADMTKFTFNFSNQAMIKTIIYFGIIYLIVMIFNTIIINKNKLINLIQANKKQEKIKIKNSIINIILFVISIIMLTVAYYMVTKGINELLKHDISILLIPISLGFVGTILFYYSVAGMLLKLISKCHNLYCRRLNTFIFKQINSKINTMVISISVICIMLFVTLCLLSSAFTIKNYFNDSINVYDPVDFQIVNKNREVDVRELLDNNIIKNNTKDILIVNDYYDENLNYGKSLGKLEETIRKEYSYVDFDSPIYVMGKSEYNKVAKLMNKEQIEIEKEQYAIVCNTEVDIYNKVLKSNSIINIFGHDFKPYKEVVDGFVTINANPFNMGFFVIDDSYINKENIHSETLSGNYNTKDEKIIDKMEEIIHEFHKGDLDIMNSTRIEIEESAAGLSAIVTFIGLYLGIIFLISSSAILALKSLSDCIDDKNKYRVLRQIGADEADINKALFKQTILFFMMPLSLAIIHTLVGLEFCKFILSSIGVNDILNGSIMTFIFLIIIYGIYFIVTYLCSKNIIKDNN